MRRALALDGLIAVVFVALTAWLVAPYAVYRLSLDRAMRSGAADPEATAAELMRAFEAQPQRGLVVPGLPGGYPTSLADRLRDAPVAPALRRDKAMAVAEISRTRGDPDGVLRATQEALDAPATPRNGDSDVLLALGQAHLALSRQDAALDAFQRAIARDDFALDSAGRAARAHAQIGAIYIARRQYDRAIEPLRRSAEIKPSYTALIDLAFADWLAGKPLEEAARDLERALNAQPRSDAGLQWKLIGDRSRDAGRLDKALEAYGHARLSGLEERHYWFDVGVAYAAARQPQPALDALAAALAAPPAERIGASDVQYQIGRVHLFLTGVTSPALGTRAFEQAAALDDFTGTAVNRADAWYQIGLHFRSLGRWDAAAGALAKAAQTRAQGAHFVALAGVEWLRGNAAEAERAVAQARAADRTQDPARVWQAVALQSRDAKRPDQALAALDRARAVGLAERQYWYDAAMVRAAAGDGQAMLDALTAGLSAPATDKLGDSDLRYQIGRAHASFTKPVSQALAIRSMQAAIRLNDFRLDAIGKADAFYQVGLYDRSLGQWDAAADALTQAIQARPLAFYAIVLASVEWARGNTAAAEQAVAQATAADASLTPAAAWQSVATQVRSLRQFGQAQIVLDRARAAGLADKDFWLDAGLIQAGVPDRARALEAYGRALAAPPSAGAGDSDVHTQIGRAYAGLGPITPTLALEAFNRALALNDFKRGAVVKADAHYQLGLLLEGRTEWAAAAEQYRAALALVEAATYRTRLEEAERRGGG